MRGIRTSNRIRSGYSCFATWTASSPFMPVTTSYPAKRKVKATRSRISGSSSAINIFVIASLFAFLVYWQCEGKSTSLPLPFAFQPNTPFVHLYQLPDNCQPQARAGCGQDERVFAAIEAVKDAGLILFGNTNSGILHVHLYFAAVLAVQMYSDPAVFWGVMIGIVCQVA